MNFIFSAKSLLHIALLICLGYPALVILAMAVEKAVKHHYTAHSAKLLKKTVLYLGLAILTVDLLREMGFKLTALLGSAGIAGMAIGFAFKTSISNIISGLFIAFENPFSVGDYIEIEDTKGVALSFDLLSVKVQSYDNNFIRIPNEKLIKSFVTNHTRYKTHRIDLTLSVDYGDDLNKVEATLKRIALEQPGVLANPEPLFFFENFGDSALQMKFCVWANTDSYRKIKNEVAIAILREFKNDGITMPYPQLVLSDKKNRFGTKKL